MCPYGNRNNRNYYPDNRIMLFNGNDFELLTENPQYSQKTHLLYILPDVNHHLGFTCIFM